MFIVCFKSYTYLGVYVDFVDLYTNIFLAQRRLNNQRQKIVSLCYIFFQESFQISNSGHMMFLKVKGIIVIWQMLILVVVACNWLLNLNSSIIKSNCMLYCYYPYYSQFLIGIPHLCSELIVSHINKKKGV